MSIGKRWLTSKEVSQDYGISAQTLANWRSTGRGPAYSKIGEKIIRYALPDLEAFFQRHRCKTTGAGTGGDP